VAGALDTGLRSFEACLEGSPATIPGGGVVSQVQQVIKNSSGDEQRDQMEDRLRLHDLPEMLTVEEVAAILRIPAKTVYLLIQRKELPARKVGRQIRVSQQSLRTYMETPG
jgi:excisionase family DNA binding protein